MLSLITRETCLSNFLWRGTYGVLKERQLFLANTSEREEIDFCGQVAKSSVQGKVASPKLLTGAC